MSNKKILLCDGDSWTAGNNGYPELSKCWPRELGKLLDIEVKNISQSGGSNDGIIRRTIKEVLSLLKEYKLDEILVVVGWSSPDRRDFYFNDTNWETFQPSANEYSVEGSGQPKDLEKFYYLWTKYFWNEEESLYHYINDNLYLHNFLESKNIKHLFFNAFYTEDWEKINDSNVYDYTIVEEFLKLFDKNFIKVSFKNFINNSEKIEDKFCGADHPDEVGHSLWAKKLYECLNE